MASRAQDPVHGQNRPVRPKTRDPRPDPRFLTDTENATDLGRKSGVRYGQHRSTMDLQSIRLVATKCQGPGTAATVYSGLVWTRRDVQSPRLSG